MSTVRPGHRAALLVVDVQVGVMAVSWNAERVIGNIVRAVERARRAQVPVIWVQHQSDDLPRDAAVWQLVPALQPGTQDGRVDKRFASSFEETSLDPLLAQHGVTHLVLAGAQTNWCIRATAYAALDRGYDLTLVSDAHTTENVLLESGRRIEAASVIDDLNLTMHGLRYPGRRCRSTPVDALDFDAPAPLDS